MEKAAPSKLNQLVLYIISGYVILLPLIYLSFVNNQFQLAKTLLTIITAVLLIAAYSFASINRKKLDIHIKPSLIPVLILASAYVASTFIQSSSTLIQALSERTFLIVSLTFIYLIGATTLTKRNLKTLLYSLLISGTLVNIAKLTNINTLNWYLTGSHTSYILLTILTIATSAGLLIKKSTIITKSILVPVILFNLAVGSFTTFKILTTAPGIINLPYSIGYKVSIDILKQPRTALLGVGPEKFLPAFTILRPISYNEVNNMWTQRPLYSSNELFHTMTTTGIIGAAGLILVILFLIKNSFSQWTKSPAVSIVNLITISSLLLIPANLTILGLLFFVLIINSLSKSNQPTITIRSLPATIFVSLLFLSIAIYALTITSRHIIADYYYTQATTNNSDRFKLLVKAQQYNPTNSNYAISYANLSIDVAEAISKKDKTLSSEDSKLIKDLIEKSIPSINRAATVLNRENPITWESRARYMKRISPVIPAALQEAIRSYSNATALDNGNPLLHIEFGQFLQSLKLYDAAQKQFETAALLKSKYANPYFNLAILYYQQGDYVKANTMINNTLNLISSADSENYSKAKELQKIIDQQLQNTTDTTPSPVSPQTNTNSNQLQPGSIEASNSSEINLNEGLQDTQQTNPALPIPTNTPVSISPTPTVSQ